MTIMTPIIPKMRAAAVLWVFLLLIAIKIASDATDMGIIKERAVITFVPVTPKPKNDIMMGAIRASTGLKAMPATPTISAKVSNFLRIVPQSKHTAVGVSAPPQLLHIINATPYTI